MEFQRLISIFCPKILRSQFSNEIRFGIIMRGVILELRNAVLGASSYELAMFIKSRELLEYFKGSIFLFTTLSLRGHK